jgi:hypothetical protein
VFALRAATGLRASTLNSVLNRLDGKRLLKRVHETSDRRYAEVRLTVEGRAYAELSRDALHELDEELAIFLSADQRVRERNLRGGRGASTAWPLARPLTFEQPPLEGTHPGLLRRRGVVPAAHVQDAMSNQEAQLIGG